MHITLIYFPDCPHVDDARAQISEAMRRAGKAAVWEEVDRSDPSTPADLRTWPSPTVLVDGRPVGPTAATAGGAACALHGAPTAGAIEAALSQS